MIIRLFGAVIFLKSSHKICVDYKYPAKNFNVWTTCADQ